MNICDILETSLLTPSIRIEEKRALTIGFILLPQFTLLPFASFIDVLRIAADEADFSKQINCRWIVMSDSSETIVSSCGVKICIEESFRPVIQFDYIVVIGGLLPKKDILSTNTKAYLAAASKNNVPLIGLCTGAFALIEAGVMVNRKCCVSHFHLEDMKRRFSNCIPSTDSTYLDEGDRITSVGGAAAAEVALLLVQRHVGRQWALKSIQILSINPCLPLQKEKQGLTSSLYIKHEKINKAIGLIQQNLSRPLNTAQLANRVNLSKRHFERLFLKETGYNVLYFYRRMRAHYALWLLINTNKNMTHIAIECGYSDSSHFCRESKLFLNKTPKHIRSMNRYPLDNVNLE